MQDDQSSQGSTQVVPIGEIYSCYTEKFGIPRQPGLVTKAVATIRIFPSFARAEMFKGLAKFSHVWVIFQFNAVLADGWKTTVRPPGLGGRHRVGVFASRSPHRPNHLGISAVQLHGIQQADNAIFLEVKGGDFLDGTPVFDIKPYLPFADALKMANRGYSTGTTSVVKVVFLERVTSFCREYEKKYGRDLAGLIRQVLHQDPRPASQRQKKVNFGMRLWDVNVRWRVKGELFEVVQCALCQDSS